MFPDRAEQRHHTATAKAWVENQAARLGISPEAIETAIKRGWLPDQIDVIETAAELLLPPPERDVFGLKVVRNG